MPQTRKRAAPKFAPSPTEVEETIDNIDGIEPVTIRYRTPTPAALDSLTLVTRQGEDLDRMDVMVRFVARHLVSWSIPRQPDVEALSQLEDSELRFRIFNIIFKSGEKAKN